MKHIGLPTRARSALSAIVLAVSTVGCVIDSTMPDASTVADANVDAGVVPDAAPDAAPDAGPEDTGGADATADAGDVGHAPISQGLAPAVGSAENAQVKLRGRVRASSATEASNSTLRLKGRVGASVRR